MTVAELISQLSAMPEGAHVDVMFPTGSDCFQISMVELLKLSGGREVVVVEITDHAPIRAV